MSTEILRQLRRWAASLRWLVADALWPRRAASLAVLGGNLVGSLAPGATIGLLLLFARSVERGSDVSLLGRSMPARDPRAIGAVASAVLLLLLASAAATYVGRRIGAGIVIGYLEECGSRALRIASLRTPPGLAGPAGLRNHRRRVAVLDARLAARATRTALNATTPLITLAWAIPALFLLDAGTTLIVAALALLLLAGQYVVNRRALAAQRGLERTSSTARDQWTAWYETLRTLPLWNTRLEHALRDDWRRGPIGARLRAYRGRLLGKAQAELASAIFFAVGMSFVLYWIGMRALLERSSWSTLVAFLLLLRMVLVSARSVLIALVSYTRLYPGVRRTHLWLAESPRPAASDDDRLVLTVRGDAPDSSLRRYAARPGARLALLSTVPADRYGVTIIEGWASGRGRRGVPGGAIDFIAPTVPATGLDTMGAWLGLPSDSIGAETAPTAEEWAARTGEERATILIDAARARGAVVLVVDDALLEGLDEDRATTLLDRLRDRIVIVHVGGDVARAAALAPDLVVAADGDGVFALLDHERLGAHREEIKARLAQSAAVAEGSDDDDDDDD